MCEVSSAKERKRVRRQGSAAAAAAANKARGEERGVKSLKRVQTSFKANYSL